MKSLLLPLLLFVTLTTSFTSFSQTHDAKLYPIYENNRSGFINASGEVIISPQFRIIGHFSEGLAPVRLNGTYGYIDATGKFVIEPKYDVAYQFVNGQAKVYLSGIPYIIDKSGKILFEHHYKEINPVTEHDISVVTTFTEKQGIINREGELIADTMFNRIGNFSEGLAVVRGLNWPDMLKTKEYEKAETGVINPEGEFVIPYGKFWAISPFTNGYAHTKQYQQNGDKKKKIEGVIDRHGNGICYEPEKRWHFPYDGVVYAEGLAWVDIYPEHTDTMKSWTDKYDAKYKGTINPMGEIIFSNLNWEEATDFDQGRAFVQDKEGDWIMIDRQGEIINSEPFESILHRPYSSSTPLFIDGLALVETKAGWCGIDTQATIVAGPINKNWPSNSLYRKGNWIVIKDDISVESNTYSYQYGLWNLNDGTYIEPQYHSLEVTKGLISFKKGENSGYINQKGEVIWQKVINDKKPELLNIDYMNRGYFYASSPRKGEYENLGGWGGSGNAFRTAKKALEFPKNQLSLIVKDKEIVPFFDQHRGMKLYIANMSQDTLVFNAQDSRLYMKLQAKDKDGKWKDIEYLPSSWCGNSYHWLYLPKNQYWEFTFPVYDGEFKTLLRAELAYKTSKKADSQIIYSNEFEGSVNPGQFWRKNGYTPNGIMDPYND